MSEVRITFDEGRLAELCRKWRILQLGLFGSVLADDFRPDSDVDVVVTFDPEAPWSLFDIVDFKAGLAEIFGREVDLVETSTIRNPYRRRAILDSRKVVYEAAQGG